MPQTAIKEGLWVVFIRCFALQFAIADLIAYCICSYMFDQGLNILSLQ